MNPEPNVRWGGDAGQTCLCGARMLCKMATWQGVDHVLHVECRECGKTLLDVLTASPWVILCDKRGCTNLATHEITRMYDGIRCCHEHLAEAERLGGAVYIGTFEQSNQ